MRQVRCRPEEQLYYIFYLHQGEEGKEAGEHTSLHPRHKPQIYRVYMVKIKGPEQTSCETEIDKDPKVPSCLSVLAVWMK